jgi:hypothetical protein
MTVMSTLTFDQSCTLESVLVPGHLVRVPDRSVKVPGHLVVVLDGPVRLPAELVVGSGGISRSQFPLSPLSTISSRVALENLSVPLEDNPPALGVQYFTVRHRSVTVTLPM